MTETKPVEMVDARQNAHARPVGKIVDLLGEVREQRRIDLEKIVTRIGFQRVVQHAAGMAHRIEAEMVFHLLDLGSQQRDFRCRRRIGRRGEKADDAQFTGDVAVLVEALDADIVHIGAAVDDRFHVRLGDDQEVRAVEKGKDFRRCRHGVLAGAQDEHVRIGKNAETGALVTLDLRLGALAGIDIFAHAEEGEVFVAQPGQESDCLVAVGLLAAGTVAAELGDDRVELGKHRLPVGNRLMNLLQHHEHALPEIGGLLSRSAGEM